MVASDGYSSINWTGPDGNKYFNRPGPSLTENINILCEILHPNLFKPNPSSKRWIKI